MYVPKIPNLNDPYDREWVAIVGIFFILLIIAGIINIIIGVLIN